jgi:hypothetical protein
LLLAVIKSRRFGPDCDCEQPLYGWSVCIKQTSKTATPATWADAANFAD